MRRAQHGEIVGEQSRAVADDYEDALERRTDRFGNTFRGLQIGMGQRRAQVNDDDLCRDLGKDVGRAPADDVRGMDIAAVARAQLG